MLFVVGYLAFSLLLSQWLSNPTARVSKVPHASDIKPAQPQ